MPKAASLFLGKHNDFDGLFCKALKHDFFITRCVPVRMILAQAH
jgi:hypothetical protein